VQSDPNIFTQGWAPPLESNDATAAVEWLLKFAASHRASDIHLQMESKACRVQLRLDGVLTQIGTLPDEAAKLILGRVKYPAKLKTYVESLPQDGRIATVKQLLIAGANSKIVDDYSFSSLHWAAQNGELEIVRFLVEEVELKSDEDRFNREPAALAKDNGHNIVSEYLINN